MRVLFGAQDVLDLTNEGYTTIAADATEAHRNMHRKMRKKDHKTLFYIHQCVDINVFEKTADSTTAKAVWDTLVWCYDIDALVKKVKLQSLRKQYENLNMKILRSLTPPFDYIVVEIKHSKDLITMRIKELQSNLEAQELHLTERNSEREVKQALKASFGKKNQKQCWPEAKKRQRGGYQKLEASNSDKKKHHKESERFDKKKVKCYYCKKFDHFAVDYWYMNTSCSNHLTGKKQWPIDFDYRRRTKIICADDKYLNIEGIRNVKVRVKNGKIVLIKDVWYVPDIREI
ncbi:uncharacterized protein LOC127107480 [Lathyrus oleraceus]|uniref:uncharacterized protein LOC127107480 n=1 Tax=Pisum sativum TaxID=3888 RepID=UPI0021D26259|nr:uncharacterized protein LOC127107480 [Pisum sativum]